MSDATRTPVEYVDELQSFVYAETFKYLYLLFSPTEVLNMEEFVLNTEGHPLRKLGWEMKSAHNA